MNLDQFVDVSISTKKAVKNKKKIHVQRKYGGQNELHEPGITYAKPNAAIQKMKLTVKRDKKLPCLSNCFYSPLSFRHFFTLFHLVRWFRVTDQQPSN